MAHDDTDPAQLAADENSLQGADVETSPTDDDAEGTPKPGGLGEDGTIPNDADGIAAGHSETPSNFNAEEDEQSDQD